MESDMANKTYLELATETVAAMINKGYLRVVPDKGDDWQSQNHKSIHTVGWAILEMYREIQSVPQKARELPKLPSRSNVKAVK
jgi:hypothetical protein